MKFVFTGESSAVHVDNIKEFYVKKLSDEEYHIFAVLRTNQRFPSSDITSVYSPKFRTHDEAWNWLKEFVNKINE